MGRGGGSPAILLVVLLVVAGVCNGQLQVGFYSKSCPAAESTVASVVRQAAAADNTILPALVRLQFHDCFVKGCDASVLIKGGNNNAELASRLDGTRTFMLMDRVFVTGGGVCARAWVQTGGPSFDVPTGRRDGKTSNLRDADALPDVHDSIEVLRSKFAANGLDDKELVLLSSAHTVGTTACFFLQDRLYNFPLPGGGRGADPSIPESFLSELRSRCAPGDFNTRLPLDRGSENSFDTSILRNIRNGFAVIASDAVLYNHTTTVDVVDSYSTLLSTFFGPYFRQDFADAMVKMGSIAVLTGSVGEVRKVCSKFN
ncbi:hypothetical protein ABZP36_009173 [Zizania latifolia]